MDLSLQDLAVGLGVAIPLTCPIKGACVDSRLLKPGDLFFALSGAKVDGHLFMAEAAAKEACAAVVTNNYRGTTYGLPLIRVDDPLAALQNWAKTVLVSSKVKVVAVTGSVGKTTTKDFAAHLLKQKFSVVSTPGNSNSQIGLPLSILNRLKGGEEVFVLEMGMTHPGQIRSLVQIAPPAIAIITSAALVHAENFDSLEAIADEKAEILTHSDTFLGIIHHEIVNCRKLKSRGSCRKITFSLQSPEADYIIETESGEWNIIAQGKSQVVCRPLDIPGAHNRLNFLAAAIACEHLGVSWEDIREAMKTLRLPERRLQTVEKNGVLFVNDAYNASEISVKAALATLPLPAKGGKRYAVLGEMAELGKFSGECHAAVGEYALEHVDMMLCSGAACKPIHAAWLQADKPVLWGSERAELSDYLRRHLKPGDVVLLKGSRSKEMWKVLDEI